MSLQVILIYCASMLMVILGFVALLKQKTYIDKDSNQPVEIDVSFFGRMKTNYPSLVFVFLGALLMYIAFEKSYPPAKHEWVIKGSLADSLNQIDDWSEGSIAIIPVQYEATIFNKGNFEIRLFIDEDKEFEDVVEVIDYSHRDGSVQLFPKRELTHYRKKEANNIKHITATTRTYKTSYIENK